MIQSERLSVYREHVEALLKAGHAYRCFCTAEELDAMRQDSLEHGSNFSTGYNRKCLQVPADEAERRAANGEPHCIRFNSGDGKAPVLTDLVYGLQRHSGKLDDFILMKQDGYPTYHFANVVDDHEMRITHVIRGAVCKTYHAPIGVATSNVARP
jgi:glutamyl-tRNA synthetase